MSAGRQIVGDYGTATEVLFTSDAPDHQGHIGTWLLHCPGQSPGWSHYALMCVHLRDIEGQSRPPTITVLGATHEVVVFAIDPECHPTANDRGPWKFVRPVNMVEQIELPGDAAAADLVERCARAVVEGELPAEPVLAGAREPWHTVLLRTAAHARGEVHASNDLNAGGVLVEAPLSDPPATPDDDTTADDGPPA